jgi:phospholipid/cholesterol/gamma-HCH transport system substrate-binding protein
MIKLRYTEEWIGLLVVIAVLVFIGAILEAGVLREWFRPAYRLRIVLPQSGIGGLAVGADVEVLGIHAGTVRRIVLNPDQRMYADADIEQQINPFIRRDSRAVIRRRFGLAGAAYVDISRGTGAPMDWSYAVVEATTERAPTDTISALVDQLRQKIFPILDDAKRSMDSLAKITENLEKGQGTLGRLLTDDTLAHQTEQVIETTHEQIAALAPVISRLDDVAKQADVLAQLVASRQEGIPDLLRRVNALLANLQATTRDLARAAPRLPEIARNVAGGTADLPGLLTQTQVTAAELERLLTQLRGLWLLGGGGTSSPEPARLPAGQIQP